MKLQAPAVSQLFGRGVVQIRRHVNILLLIFFMGAVALAGFIFWQYGYQVTLQEPEVTVRSVAPKENELRALIEKAEKRDVSRDAVFERVFSDPFIQPEKPH